MHPVGGLQDRLLGRDNRRRLPLMGHQRDQRNLSPLAAGRASTANYAL